MITVKSHLCVKQLIVSDLLVCGASSQKSASAQQTNSHTISCSMHSCAVPILSPVSLGRLCYAIFRISSWVSREEWLPCPL